MYDWICVVVGVEVGGVVDGNVCDGFCVEVGDDGGFVVGDYV